MNSDTPSHERADRARQSEEARVRTVLEASPAGFSMNDESGRYEMVNTAHCTMLGYQPEELIGQHFAAIFPEDRRASAHQGHLALLALDQPKQMQVELRRKDGTAMTALCSVVSITGDDGERHRVTFMMDITEHERTAADLRSSEARLRAQYQGLPIPTLTWQRRGSDFVLIDCNRAGKAEAGTGTASRAVFIYTNLREPGNYSVFVRCIPGIFLEDFDEKPGGLGGTSMGRPAFPCERVCPRRCLPARHGVDLVPLGQ